MLNEVEQLKDHLEKALELMDRIHDDHPFECERCPVCERDGECGRFEVRWVLSAVNRYRLSTEMKRRGF